MASIHSTTLQSTGTAHYEVRWHGPDGRTRSKTFRTLADAKSEPSQSETSRLPQSNLLYTMCFQGHAC